MFCFQEIIQNDVLQNENPRELMAYGWGLNTQSVATTFTLIILANSGDFNESKVNTFWLECCMAQC